MKLVAPIKLLPTPEQRGALLRTLRAANAACSKISDTAWEAQVFTRFKLHHLVYGPIRESTGLAAQVVVLCIAKVAACYKRDRKHKHSFRDYAAQPFDDRVFRMLDDDAVSIWTVDGRETIPFVCCDHQRELLAHRKGEVDLCLRGGDLYLMVTCDLDEAPVIEPVDALGVDLGVVNIAYDSDGERFSGEAVERIRRIYAHRRRNLQKRRTASSRRKLRAIAGRQTRYQRDQNHCISKAIVQKAKRTARAIVLEDLKGIRSRVTASRRQRARLANWGFHQLRSFIDYKARMAGVPVVLVDPGHTSQTCPLCGHVSRSNRPDRDSFRCRSCGHAGAADHVAALNIRARAIVDWPNGSHLAFQGSVPTPKASASYKPPALAGGS